MKRSLPSLEGEGGMSWEEHQRRYTTVWNRQLAGSCCATRRAAASSAMTPRSSLEGWDGARVWGTAQEGGRLYLIHFVVQQKRTQYCKAIVLQLKKQNKTWSSLLCDLPTPLLAMCLRKAIIWTWTWTPVVTEALLTVAGREGNLNVHQWMDRQRSCGT